MSNNSKEVKFIDLHTTGLGFLNRARLVTPDRGDPYLAVSIAAMHGSIEKPEYSYFDTRVVGDAACHFVEEHFDTVNDRDHKVLVRFKVGDGVPDSYEVKNGDHKGQRRHIIKSRLLKITWAKIDDEVVLESSPLDAQSEQAENREVNDTAATPAESGSKFAGASGNGDTVEGESSNPPEVKELPATVRLRQDDPKFDAKKARLQQLGYKFDDDAHVWRKPVKAA